METTNLLQGIFETLKNLESPTKELREAAEKTLQNFPNIADSLMAIISSGLSESD